LVDPNIEQIVPRYQTSKAMPRLMHQLGIRFAFALAALLFAVPSAAQAPRELRIPVAPAETLQVGVWGTGTPVVIVPSIWSSTFGFRKVIPRLVGYGMQVIVIEPLGVASSSRTEKADYSITAQGRRIGAVLDSLRIHDALFVGQALSTAMILRFAVKAPDRVRGLVSVEGGATEVSATPGMRAALSVAALLVRIFPSQRLLRSRMRKNFENVSGDRSWITEEVLDGYMAPLSHRVRPTVDAYRAMARSREPGLLSTQLNNVHFPVELVLGGAPHFGGVGEEELAPMERSLAGLRITKVPGAGHVINEEQPEAIVSAVERLRRRVAENAIRQKPSRQ
jgi:pimeloyl-ACP methyl ester carboxylesterase